MAVASVGVAAAPVAVAPMAMAIAVAPKAVAMPAVRDLLDPAGIAGMAPDAAGHADGRCGFDGGCRQTQRQGTEGRCCKRLDLHGYLLRSFSVGGSHRWQEPGGA